MNKKPSKQQSNTYNSPSSISIGDARQKLGERGKKMTDQQIADLLSTLRLLCNKTIDAVVNNK